MQCKLKACTEIAPAKPYPAAKSGITAPSSTSISRPKWSYVVAFALLPAATSASARAQTLSPTITLPAGTPLAVSTVNHLPMRAGEFLITHTLYPIYAANALVLPAGTPVTGTVVSLHPDHAARIDARLGGDFTPLDRPVVRFTAIVLPSGVSVPIATDTATDGAPIYRVVAPPPHHGGFLHQQYEQLRKRATDSIAIVTAPDKVDRAKQFLYGQLPYHPQRIQKGTSWTVETATPTTFPVPASPVPTPATDPGASAGKPVPDHVATPATPDTVSKPWLVKAYLADSMSSATAKPGQTIQATVAQPIFNPDGTVAVPQGSVLSGRITQAQHARTFGRAARLRFRFTTLTVPGAEAQSVRTSLAQVDSNTPNSLIMTSEGEVKPKPRDKLAVPLILFVAASQPLHTEQGRDQIQKNAVGSNSLGLIGFIIGTAARQANLAAGIGFYGTALSIYQRLIRRGPEVAFMRDTRIVVQTTPTNNTPLQPTAH